jgi:hypothetical protein
MFDNKYTFFALNMCVNSTEIIKETFRCILMNSFKHWRIITRFAICITISYALNV